MIHGFFFDAGHAHMGNWWTGTDLTASTYKRLNLAQNIGHDAIHLTFHRQNLEDPLWSGNIRAYAKTALNKLITEAYNRGLSILFGKDWKHDEMICNPSYRWYAPGANDTERMINICKLWKSIALEWGNDPRITAFGMPFGDNGLCPPDDWYPGAPDRVWRWYTSLEGCEWWAPLLQIWLDTMWDVNPNLTLIAPMMTTMGAPQTLENDYWTPNLPGADWRGPIIWEKDAVMSYTEVLNPTPTYPYRSHEVKTLEWARRWNQRVISECIHGFVGGLASIGMSSYWEWNSQTLQWLRDWLAKREQDNFDWWWESYGFQGGEPNIVADPNGNSEYVRAYLDKYGNERPHTGVIRSFLTGLPPPSEANLTVDSVPQGIPFTIESIL